MNLINPETRSRLALLEDIYTSLRLNSITFSKTVSMKIVGGRTTLERLVASGKIRMKKRNAQFGRWECVAEDVLRHTNYKERNGNRI